METNIKKILLVFILFPLQLSANEDAVFLFHDFIVKESQGGRVQRLDTVVYERESYPCISGAGEYMDAEVDLDVDPFYLITNLQFSAKKNDVRQSFFDVDFSVVGELYYPCGTKVIDGEARLFKANKTAMNVTYQLKKVEKSWVIVNPPKPFVTCSAYGKFLDDEIATLKTTLAKKKRELPRIDALLARFEAERLFLGGVCFNES